VVTFLPRLVPRSWVLEAVYARQRRRR
jgi:hypothetical protein